MSDGPINRDEFRWLANRVDSIDHAGTRGEVGLAMQVKQVISDIGMLRADLNSHRQDHLTAERARVVGRRWIIGAVIALIAAIDGPLVTVLLGMAHR